MAKVSEGMLILEPHPFGQGGLLLTDRSYKDFELSLECLPDPGYNSGIFVRSSEGGSACAGPLGSAGPLCRRPRAHRVDGEGRRILGFRREVVATVRHRADLPWAQIRDQAMAGYNAYFTTHMVGEKKPNAWGLYDVMGNVWEWVQDRYNDKLFADPKPPASGREHVLEGGGFAADVKNAIPATHAAGPGSGFDVGLRMVRDIR